jgi:hypothetical protein
LTHDRLRPRRSYHPAMLAVDPGNTNVTLGLFRAGELVATIGRGVTGVDATEPETLRGLAILHAEVSAGRPLGLELG